MNQYFAASYTGTPFQLFGFDHLIANLLILLVIVAIAFMILGDGFRPTWRSIWRTVLITNIYMAIITVVNVITGGNYMYIARTPEFPTVIDYMGPWPWYIIGLELIGLTCFVLAYLPWAIRDWRAVLAQAPRVG